MNKYKRQLETEKESICQGFGISKQLCEYSQTALNNALVNVVFNLIWKEQCNFIKANGKYPNQVKIHPIHKSIIESSATMVLGFVTPSEEDSVRIMGMKLVYDSSIEQDAVVCSYNII